MCICPADNSEEFVTRWKVIGDDLQMLENVEGGCCISKTTPTQYKLVTFTDTSKHAYAAAVYLKLTDKGLSNVELIFAKNRLDPMKSNLKIPRMELIGCKTAKYVAQE